MASAPISALFPSAQRCALDASAALSAYESGQDASQQCEMSLHTMLDTLQRDCGEMDRAANNEGARREMWRARVQGLKDEHAQLLAAFTRARQKNPHSSFSEQRTREQLFSGRSSAAQQASVSAMQHHITQGDSLARSNRFVDDIQNMGEQALNSLRNQRATLKNAHRKAFDMANTLGMSNSLMRLIGREDSTNAYITYACMLLTLIVVFALWCFVRR